MQLQPDFGHLFLQGGKDPAGLLLCCAVHHGVVGIALEFDHRELPFQPHVERVMHEEIGEHGTEHAPNAKGDFCFEVTLGIRWPYPPG